MKSQTPYRPVAQQPGKEHETKYCATRNDNAGFLNISKICFIFVLHLVACILFFVSVMKWVHKHHFRPGAPPSTVFEVDGPLYQTQVTGLVSLALVFVRLLAACCTAPLLWTVILVLLENRGMALSEISRLNNYQVPILPKSQARGWWWFGWSTLVVLLLWPPNFASPIAHSSLAWFTDIYDLGPPASFALNGPTDNPESQFLMLRTSEWQMTSLMKAAVRVGAVPAYAFQEDTSARYFSRPSGMTKNSQIFLPVPYLDIKIRWIDPTTDNRTQHIANTTFSDYVGSRDNGLSRANGSVVVVNDEPWNRTDDWPSKASKFKEERLVAIKVAGFGSGDRNKDGSNVTACPEESSYLRPLPNYPRTIVGYSVGEEWENDCYQVGIVTFEAALYQNTECYVAFIGNTEAAATCAALDVDINDGSRMKDDWVAPVATNMVSEISKSAVMLGYAAPFLNEYYTVEEYTTGVLQLAYHAAWSSVIELMPVSENVTWKQANLMARAWIQKEKIYAWLAMHLTVEVAAILVYAVLRFSSVKFVRDTTLAPLRLDLSSVIHHPLSNGLCDAVVLNKEDRKLPMIKFFKNAKGGAGEDYIGVTADCRRRLVFADDAGNETHGS